MPKKPEVDTSPSDGLIDQSMQRAYAKVSKEYPNIKKTTVKPNSWWDNLLDKFSPSDATTNMFGGIRYSPEHVSDLNQQDREQLLTHELTHVGQPAFHGLWDRITSSLNVPEEYKNQPNASYYWNPTEMEAMQASRDRTLRLHLAGAKDPATGMGDIELFPPSEQTGIDTAPRNVKIKMYQPKR